MYRALALATLLAVLSGAASGQPVGVLHIKVTVPLGPHALLISDNPATTTPRRVVTGVGGTVDVRLRPGNYTVESDEPSNFEGRSYQWTQTLDVPAGRDVVLELTARNAEVGAPVAPPPPQAPRVPDPLHPRWQDSVVTVWTPRSRGTGVVVDAAGLVVTNERVVGSDTAMQAAIDVQLTPSLKVPARVLKADHERDVAILWIDSATASALRPVPPDCADTTKDLWFARIGPIADVCAVMTIARKAMETAPPPVATRLPTETQPPIAADVLDAEVKRRAGNLSPSQLSSPAFDIAFLTPVQIKGARTPEFGELSAYFGENPAVLAVRVTPKMAESFWAKVARGAAYTQGAALPAFNHFKPGFLRMQAFCGDAEVVPIHPFVLERRITETEGTREGLYVFDPASLGPQCASVKLVLYSEKEPDKPETRIVDPKVIERIRQDFAIMSPAK